MVKILEHIAGILQARGMTRTDLAEKMGEPWDKDKLDKIFSSDSCPRAETIAEMLAALKEPTYPPSWYRAKKVREED